MADLPALTARDLDVALELAAEAARGGHPLGFVVDHEGTGTTAVTVAPGAGASTRFGAGSRALHASAGYVELAVPQESTLRLDVDDESALQRSVGRLGEASRRLLD
jgi:2-phospho-L-lactate guanylyltransferase